MTRTPIAPATVVQQPSPTTSARPPHRPSPISLLHLQARLHPLPAWTALLGTDETGRPLLLHLPGPTVGHLLVVGAGKEDLVRALLASLALAHDPLDLRLAMVDPAGRAAAPFHGLPHLLNPPLPGPPGARHSLEWLARELAWRRESGCRLPRVVVLVYEALDLLGQDLPTEAIVRDLAQHGQRVGLHLLFVPRDPAVAAIGTPLGSILPCRISGAQPSALQARLATGVKRSGAERLQRGAFLLVAGGELVPFRAARIDRAAIPVLVEMVQDEGRKVRCRLTIPG